MRIGLFGGTFNPIHRCHLTIAGQVRDRFHLDRVAFIPTGDPPHKSSESLAPAGDRINMVRLAIAGIPSFVVSDVEVRRPAKSYSIDTVRTLRAESGPGTELFFIVGLDAFVDFPGWKEASDLLRLCHFVIVSRPGTAFTSLIGLPLIPAIPRAALEALDVEERDRLDAGIPGGTRLTLLRLPPCDASASDIRARFRKRLPSSNLLPASVESYIIRRGLYQEETDRTRVQG